MRQKLLKTGVVGSPYSKYQRAAVELTQKDSIPEKKLMILNRETNTRAERINSKLLAIDYCCPIEPWRKEFHLLD